MSTETLKVCIVYPTDPFDPHPGGIDTFIVDELNNAPDFVEYSLIGVTTNPKERPAGTWIKGQLGKREINFHPVIKIEQRAGQFLVPVSLTFTAALATRHAWRKFDAIEFHRMEPLIAAPKGVGELIAVVHQHPEEVFNSKSDNRWKFFPRAYLGLESLIVPRLEQVFSVQHDAADYYQEHFSNLRGKSHKLTTWADASVFKPLHDAELDIHRMNLRKRYDMPCDTLVLVTVGRLAEGKNPLLLMEAFAQAAASNSRLRLIWVGDGNLRGAVESSCESLGIADKVYLPGVQPRDQVASILQASDLFVFSSLYDAMPMSIMEALNVGIPVATTPVGQVDQMVIPGRSGVVAKSFDADCLSSAILESIRDLNSISGPSCRAVAKRFSPIAGLAALHGYYDDMFQRHHGGGRRSASHSYKAA